MKSKEVLNILRIKRCTLLKYVNKGLIRLIDIDGQYCYDDNDVYKLLNKYLLEIADYCHTCLLYGNCKNECDGLRKYKTVLHSDIDKSFADCRNNNLDPDSSIGFGYITEVLVSKFLKLPTCFEFTDNFHYPKYDLLEHEDWGLINVKGSLLHIREYGQPFWSFNTKKNKKADFFFCIGYDEYRSHVESVYIIPNEDYISKLRTIHITEFGYSKFDIFDEDPKPWDDLFHTLKLDNCPVLKSRANGGVV